jgi:hypothetical protein
VSTFIFQIPVIRTELDIFSLNQQTEENRTKWGQHLQRTDGPSILNKLRKQNVWQKIQEKNEEKMERSIIREAGRGNCLILGLMRKNNFSNNK